MISPERDVDVSVDAATIVAALDQIKDQIIGRHILEQACEDHLYPRAALVAWQELLRASLTRVPLPAPYRQADAELLATQAWAMAAAFMDELQRLQAEDAQRGCE
jgi:hypothetical protein